MEFYLFISVVTFAVLAMITFLTYIANKKLTTKCATPEVLYDNSWKGRSIRKLRDWTCFLSKIGYLISHVAFWIMRAVFEGLVYQKTREAVARESFHSRNYWY